MTKQILIIGLGNFGMSLAKSLSQKGAEVLAIDKKRTLVEEANEFVSEAVIMDATDEAELTKFEPQHRDCAICAIGDESKENSIICTALLRQMGVPLIVSRANDKLHERILRLVGAHKIVNPEDEFGRRFANKILYRNVINETLLGNDLHLVEICAQPSMIGKNLIELSLPKKFGIVVAAIRRGKETEITPPSPNEKISQGDNLIIVANEDAITKLMKEF